MCNLTAWRLPFKISCKGAELGSSLFWYKQQGTLCGDFNTIIQTKNHFIFFGSPLPVIPNNVSDKIFPLPHTHTHTNLSLFQVLDNFWQVRWCFTSTYVSFSMIRFLIYPLIIVFYLKVYPENSLLCRSSCSVGSAPCVFSPG